MFIKNDNAFKLKKKYINWKRILKKQEHVCGVKGIEVQFFLELFLADQSMGGKLQLTQSCRTLHILRKSEGNQTNHNVKGA